jgi:hypothetical protein
MINEWVKSELLRLELAYQHGNLGALKDAVYWCREYQQPLPEWANLAIFETINTLALGDKKNAGKWSAWLRQYQQDMADYEIWSLVDEARSHGAAWADIYSIAGALLTNSLEGEKNHPSNETIKKTHQRVGQRLKTESHRYYQLKTFKKRNDDHPFRKELMDSIKKTIKTGKTKANKNK